jgi:hypothetical protein
LQACASSFPKHPNPDQEYFADASDCFRSSERKQVIKVPMTGRQSTATAAIEIALPMGMDDKAFSFCMEQQGHPPAKVDLSEYLSVSRSCMEEARNSPTPSEAYAQCVRHGGVTIETLKPD